MQFNGTSKDRSQSPCQGKRDLAGTGKAGPKNQPSEKVRPSWQQRLGGSLLLLAAEIPVAFDTKMTSVEAFRTIMEIGAVPEFKADEYQ